MVQFENYFNRIFAVGIIFFFDGTGDAGDSISHYLISRYSWKHPELFLDHWGKPFFTLISSTFSQYGFIGIKVFNVLMMASSLYFTVNITQALFPNHEQRWYSSPLWSALFFIAAPLPFILTFSGLTEPLFAALISGALYFLIIKRDWKIAAGLSSFLPFVRSEGLIVIGVWGIYFLCKYLIANSLLFSETEYFKKINNENNRINAWTDWRNLNNLFIAFIILSTGHLLYAVIGLLFKGDLLWVFREIPYAQIEQVYGTGDISHFAVQLTYILGIPIYIFFILGIIQVLLQVFQDKKTPFYLEKVLLILGGFLTFFVAHSLFWYLGIFKSMGLNRVFVGIMPLITILAFGGYKLVLINFIGGRISKLEELELPSKIQLSKLKHYFGAFSLFYVAIFPLTSNPAAVKWEHDMTLHPEQILLEEVASYLEQNQLLEGTEIYCAHPYLAVKLDMDPFGERYHILDKWELEHLPNNAVVVWDDWFAFIDKNISITDVKEDRSLKYLESFQVSGKREVKFNLFVKQWH